MSSDMTLVVVASYGNGQNRRRVRRIFTVDTLSRQGQEKKTSANDIKLAMVREKERSSTRVLRGGRADEPVQDDHDTHDGLR
jgi:hypothetical protein